MTYHEKIKKENSTIPHVPSEVYKRILVENPQYIEIIAVPDLKTLQWILQEIEESHKWLPDHNTNFSESIEYVYDELYKKVYNYIVYERDDYSNDRIYTTLYIQV